MRREKARRAAYASLTSFASLSVAWFAGCFGCKGARATMEPDREAPAKRARTDGSDVAESPIDTLPNALLERIFAEHFSAAEAWLTARGACRKLRQLVEAIEWRELKARGTRAAAFETLSAVVRGGRLRLSGGGSASVELEIEYRDLVDFDDASGSASSAQDPDLERGLHAQLLSEVEINALGRAACEALRACTQAAGALHHVGVNYRMSALDSILLRFERQRRKAIGREIISSQIIGTLFALRPPLSASSSLLSLSIRQEPAHPEDDDHHEEEERRDVGSDSGLKALPNKFDVSAEAFLYALAPFSGLRSLVLPSWVCFDREQLGAVAGSCPDLRRLHVRLQYDSALLGLAPLSKLEELRWWESQLVLGGSFVEFATTPAGRHLRDVGHAHMFDDFLCKVSQPIELPALLGLAAMESLERMVFGAGLNAQFLRLHPPQETREAVAAIGACRKLVELSFACCPGYDGAGAGIVHGLADAIERSKSLRHLDLWILLLEDEASAAEGWAPSEEALLRLVAAAAPVLRSATVIYWQNSPEQQTRLWSCLRAAGPLGEELAGPADHGLKVEWRRAESTVLAAASQVQLQ
eukprot:tig00000441_g716.t1